MLRSDHHTIERRAESLEFLIGRDAGGHWLAVETHGLAGGYFSSANDALRFVASDFEGRATRVELVDTIVDPFDRTCLDIAERCRGQRAVA